MNSRFEADNALIDLRKQKHLTIAQICRTIKLNNSTYSAFERGVKPLNDERLCQIADYFGVTVNDIRSMYDEAESKYQYWLKNTVFKTEQEIFAEKIDEIKAYIRSGVGNQAEITCKDIFGKNTTLAGDDERIHRKKVKYRGVITDVYERFFMVRKNKCGRITYLFTDIYDGSIKVNILG